LSGATQGDLKVHTRMQVVCRHTQHNCRHVAFVLVVAVYAMHAHPAASAAVTTAAAVTAAAAAAAAVAALW
jgi:hypothetical protein